MVTESFTPLVLDPRRDVLLETYTARCDACRALAPRVRMLAQLCAQHLPQLRVAAMDVLDNDRDPEHLPEKWTPAFRLFLRADGDGADHGGARGAGGVRGEGGAGGGEGRSRPQRKRSVLLNYGDEAPAAGAGGDGGSDNGAAPPAAAGAFAPVVPAAAPAPSRVVLPSIPELLAFVAEATRGRLAPSPALAALADAAEAEAVQLERAYDAAMDYGRLAVSFEQLLDEREAAALVGAPPADEPAAAAAAGGALFAAPRAEAARLRQLAREAANYIATEAATGGVDGAVERLDRAHALVERAGIARELRAAAAAAEAAAEGAAQQRLA